MQLTEFECIENPTMKAWFDSGVHFIRELLPVLERPSCRFDPQPDFHLEDFDLVNFLGKLYL